MPGGCPEVGALRAEVPRLLQRDWPGNSLSTCEEERKEWLPGFITEVPGAEGGKSDRHRGGQAMAQGQTPVIKSPAASFPLEASDEHSNLTQTLRNK